MTYPKCRNSCMNRKRGQKRGHPKYMNIVLTGFMGTGKTVVGQCLAKQLGWEFYDTDTIIEKEAGLAIREIFKLKGEGAFRNMETQTIRLLSALDNRVIATGGGVPLRTENMEALERNGVVFCLEASPEVILSRIGAVFSRPLLNPKDPIGSIRKLLTERSRAYGRCRARINTDNLSVEQVVDKILEFIPNISS